MADPAPVALLGQFGTPERLVAAADAARHAGWLGIDAFTPFPVPDLDPILAIGDRRIPLLALGGGLFGLVAAYAMQIATNLDYRIDIGGRPLLALQSFALIGFELTILFAVGTMLAGFFILNRLPRYHQSLFWVDRFERATRDGFFLLLPTDRDSLEKARIFLGEQGADSIDAVPR